MSSWSEVSQTREIAHRAVQPRLASGRPARADGRGKCGQTAATPCLLGVDAEAGLSSINLKQPTFNAEIGMHDLTDLVKM